MAQTRDKDLWCVGLMYDSQEDKKAGKVSGYRVYGCAVEGYKDVDVSTMKQQLIQYPGRVRGLKISDKSGEVIGSCGDIGNYPKSIKGAFSSEQEQMLLIGKLPGSGVKIYFLNSCWWLSYECFRALLSKFENNNAMTALMTALGGGTEASFNPNKPFANATPLSGREDADFDALTTLDGIGVAEYDPNSFDKNGRSIADLYDDAAKRFGLAVDADEMRRKIAKGIKEKDEAEAALQKAITEAKSAGIRVINRHSDNTGGLYLRNASGFTVEERLIRASRVLRSYAPFMYSAWTALKKVDTYDIKTAAVSLREFMYNPSFINAISDSYLHHLIEHEMSHVLMEHVMRGFDKQGDIWNMACDLSVNARIAYEHGLRFIGDERQIVCKNTNNDNTEPVKLESTISSVLNRCNSTKIDLNKDTATSIYFEILEEMKQQQQQGQQSQQGQQGQGQQGQCQQGQQGQSQQQQQGQQQGQGQEQGQQQQGQGQGKQQQKQQQGQGQGRKGQGQEQQGQGQNSSSEYKEGYAQGFKDAQNGKKAGQEQNQGTEQNAGGNNTGTSSQIQGNQQTTSGGTQMKSNTDWKQGYSDGFNDGWNDSEADGNSEHGGTKASGKSGVQQGGEQYVTFRGERIKLDPTDIVMTPEEASLSKGALEQASRSFLIGIVERHRRQFGTFGGEAGSYYERIVEEALAPRVNWKSAIRKRFMDVCGRDRSYRTPDRRFVSRGLYLAGNSAQIPDMLKNLKVCFDMSGSIGSEDVGVCLSQLEQLLKEFKCSTAELLFWDTEIRERVEFNNYKELLKKARYTGGGGTDCNCVFAEFESADYKNRKKQKPGYIIIFTDGVFGPIEDKYKKYGNNTIWVLPDFATTSFKAPFGLKSEFSPIDTKPAGN